MAYPPEPSLGMPRAEGPVSPRASAAQAKTVPLLSSPLDPLPASSWNVECLSQHTISHHLNSVGRYHE